MNVKYTLGVRKKDIDDFIFPPLLMSFQFQTLQQYSTKKNTLQHYSTEKSNKLQQKQMVDLGIFFTEEKK